MYKNRYIATDNLAACGESQALKGHDFSRAANAKKQ
jgi:hypothetical protein